MGAQPQFLEGRIVTAMSHCYLQRSHKAKQLGSEVVLPQPLLPSTQAPSGGGGSAFEVSVTMAKTVTVPCISVTISFEAHGRNYSYYSVKGGLHELGCSREGCVPPWE